MLNCTAQPRCAWVGGACRLGLYTTSTFAVAPNGSAPLPTVTFQDLCGGINEARP